MPSRHVPIPTCVRTNANIFFSGPIDIFVILTPCTHNPHITCYGYIYRIQFCHISNWFLIEFWLRTRIASLTAPHRWMDRWALSPDITYMVCPLCRLIESCWTFYLNCFDAIHIFCKSVEMINKYKQDG